MKMNFFIILVTLGLILVPSFAIISSSQSNDTLSDEALSNQSSFSTLSREFADQSESDGESGEEDE
jgi:hypothetical protein